MTPPLSEDALRNQVQTVAGRSRRGILGYMVFHPPNCKTRSGRWSSSGITGWPDTTFLRAPREVRAEFKGRTAEITPEQIATLNELRECGAEVFLWRVGVVTLEEIINYLRPRLRPSCPWTDPFTVGPWTAESLRAAGVRVRDRLERLG